MLIPQGSTLKSAVIRLIGLLLHTVLHPESGKVQNRASYIFSIKTTFIVFRIFYPKEIFAKAKTQTLEILAHSSIIYFLMKTHIHRTNG